MTSNRPLGDYKATCETQTEVKDALDHLPHYISGLRMMVTDPQVYRSDKRGFIIDQHKVSENIPSLISIMKEAIAKLEATKRRIDSYEEKEMKGNHKAWLTRMVEQEGDSLLHTKVARSLKTCTPEALKEIEYAAAYVSEYKPAMIKEIEEADLGTTTTGSLVLQFIRERTTGFGHEHELYRITMQQPEIIRKIAGIIHAISSDIGNAKRKKEEGERKAAKKQKMNNQ